MSCLRTQRLLIGETEAVSASRWSVLRALQTYKRLINTA